jgi:hypothetical protein
MRLATTFKNKLRSAGLIPYRSSPVVVGLGLNKTGTTSLCRALQYLGYRHKSFDLDLLEEWSKGHTETVLRAMEGYGSFEDWPYPLMYEEIMQRYGRSARYVLTMRSSPDVWLESLKAHALRMSPAIARYRSMAYGWEYPHLNEKAHLDFYAAHNNAVRAAARRHGVDDLLIEVCWEHGHGWSELCSLIGCRSPSSKFPHANPAKPNRTHLAANLQRIAEMSGSAQASAAPAQP